MYLRTMRGLEAIVSKLSKLQLIAAKAARSVTPQTLIHICRQNWGVVTDLSYSPIIDEDWLAHNRWQTLLGLEIALRDRLHEERGQHKHLAVAIVGAGGTGKTTYAILSAINALIVSRGYPFRRAVEEVMKLTTFTADETISLLKSLVNESRWVPFVIVDDAGAQISKYWLWMGERWWSNVFSIFDQLKDWVGVLILTARSLTSVAARLREIVDIVIEATEVNAGGAILDVFWWFKASDYKTGLTRKARSQRALYVDAMPASVFMPQRAWMRMTQARKDVAKHRLEHMEEMRRRRRGGRRGGEEG